MSLHLCGINASFFMHLGDFTDLIKKINKEILTKRSSICSAYNEEKSALHDWVDYKG